MGEFLKQLIAWATEVIATVGYSGIALLIGLEAVFPPIPSEVILPLSGSLSASGHFNLVAAIVAATRLKCPLALRLPESGSITSDGIGGKTASNPISSAMPG